MSNKPNSRWWRWTALWEDIVDRFRDPLEHPTFLIFFIFIVFILGCAGVWVELLKLILTKDSNYSIDGLITALVTYAAALIGSSCTQICISETESKSLRALSLGLLILYAFGFVCAALGIGKGLGATGIWTFASLFALAVWWIANAKEPGLRDPDAPVGGSMQQVLPGNLTGYNT